MRILHLINNLDRGGIETWLVSILKHTPRSDYTMDICCRGISTGSMTEDVQRLGVEVHHIRFGVWHLGFYFKLKHLIESGQYDILHSHMETYSGFATWIGQQAGIPVINTYHNTDTPPQTSLTSLPVIKQLRALYGNVSIPYALNNSAYITGVSSSVLQVLEVEDYLNASVVHCSVDIPAGIDAGTRDKFRESCGWGIKDPIIIHVGRFYEQKNHVAVLEIFRKVKKQIPGTRLLLVGDGILRPDLEARVREYELGDHVKFLGIRDDVPYLLACSDTFLMPSLFEGFGLAALEASACGLPVIASRTTGLTEVVSDGKTGLLFDVDDLEGMSQSIVYLLTHPDELRAFGQRGRQYVIDKFSVQSTVQLLERLYDACYRGS